MPLTNGTENSKKRRHLEEDVGGEPDLQTNAGLQMFTDEEGDDASSDDGGVEDFPEIVPDSESDSAEDENGEEETDEETDNSDLSLHIFPKAKTVVSNITKQPKLVYPEIDPDYDSDSSTEDVSDVLPRRFPLP